MLLRRWLLWVGVFVISGMSSARTAHAELVLMENLHLWGNADVFYRHANRDQNTVQLSQYQLDIEYNHRDRGLFSYAQFEGRGGDVFQNNQMDKNQFRIEAAYLGYRFGGGLELRLGRMLSPSGYEGAEPWRRFSRISAFGGIFAYLHNGAALLYRPDPIMLGGEELHFIAYGSFVDGVWSGDTDLNDPSFEAALGFDWGTFSLRADLAYERYNDHGSPDLVDQNRRLLNIWAQYLVGDLTVAAELNRQDEINGAAGGLWASNGALLFVKYAITRHWLLGVRGSFARYTDRSGAELFDSKELTFAPRWQIFDQENDTVYWDVRADFRAQIGDDAIQGFKDGFVFEVGTTVRY
jgi:hypothetical protein